MAFVLPPRSKVGYLDPEIAGEGTKVELSDGQPLSWNPPPAKPVMPDWSQIKSIQRYFNKTGYDIYPAWIYHPTEKPKEVQNADEAAALGVYYRKRTEEERMRFGAGDVWDYAADSKWRAYPYHAPKFDPQQPGHGKTYIASPPNPTIAQNELLRDLVPLVTAAVAAAVKKDAAAPTNIDPADWDEFVKFQAWKKSEQAVNALAQAPLDLGTKGKKAS